MSLEKLNLRELIPKNKGDLQTAERLKNYSYEQVKTIVPELLEWIQDMNWPIAGTVANYLDSISKDITNDIIKILKGNDEEWKYWCVSVFGLNTKNPIADELMMEFIRIAANPTPEEIYAEVQELTLEFIKTK